MAAVTLSYLTPAVDTSEGTADKRRRVVMPANYSHLWLRVYQPDSACYVELVDAADGSDRGTAYETVPAGTQRWIYIGRGECAVSCAGTSEPIELTAVSADGI
jgi:hypothetical protein